jgi:hypothetical protein
LKNRPEIVVIDDLDRSSLAEEDKWALLSNVWKHKIKHLVLVGYTRESSKVDLLELASKLGGKTSYLPIDQEVNYSIATEKDLDFPFDRGKKNELDWMNYIAPRDLSLIISEVLRDSVGETETFKTCFYLTKLIEKISSNLNLYPFDRQNIIYNLDRYNDQAGKATNCRDNHKPGNYSIRFETDTENNQPLAADIVRKVYDSLLENNHNLVKDLFLSKGLNQEWRANFPTMFKFEKSKKGLKNLYGI